MFESLQITPDTLMLLPESDKRLISVVIGAYGLYPLKGDRTVVAAFKICVEVNSESPVAAIAALRRNDLRDFSFFISLNFDRIQYTQKILIF